MCCCVGNASSFLHVLLLQNCSNGKIMLDYKASIPNFITMKGLGMVAVVLTIIGGLNWGLIGLFEYNHRILPVPKRPW